MFSPISSSPRRCQPFHRAMPWTSSKAIARHGCIGLDHFSLGIRWASQTCCILLYTSTVPWLLQHLAHVFFLQPDSHSGAASNAFVCIWHLVDSVDWIDGFVSQISISSKIREWVSTSLLCFFACRQYKGFNSRAMRFEAEFLMRENFKFENVCQTSREILTLEVERAGEGPGPGRLTNAVSLAVIKTDCLYRSSLPGMLLSCETTPYSYLLYIYTLSININI